ncbi:MAG TPA: hypothetical protein VLB27_02945 [candidate division Zixibacteria bacterium]|nr:hypothetical protein [candidate division Zixibacteria bacterium]
MQKLRLTVVFGALLALGATALLTDRGAAEEGFSPVGTWKLVKRVLPDGTAVTPPAVDGLFTLTKTQRNFNVTWLDPDGKRASVAIMSDYSFDGKTWSETNRWYLMYLEGEESPVTVDASDVSGSSEVTLADGVYSFQMPLHNEPAVTFSGDKLVATMEGVFEDHWERVK